MLNGKHHSVSLFEGDDFYARLHPGTLLGQYELTTGEINARPRQQNHGLQRKEVFRIDVLVQAVVIVLAVTQQAEA